MSQLKTGNEHFLFNGFPTGYLLNDFWSWQASDLLNNTLRGALAEFIVAKALGIEINSPREDWSEYDLNYFGCRIEVKASAYVQSWEQKGLSRISFSVKPTLKWTSDNGFIGNPKRHSDMYIFCLLKEKSRADADPLNLSQWEFYPVLTVDINNNFCDNDTLSLSSVISLCHEPYDFYSLKDSVLWLKSDMKDIEAMERIHSYKALNLVK